MFSRFRNIFDTKSASFLLSSWFFMDIKFMYDCSADCFNKVYAAMEIFSQSCELFV